MPMVDGSLTTDEMSMVTGKLHQMWDRIGGRPNCRSCGSALWYIHPTLIGNRSDTLSVLDRHTRLPTVAVYCRDCGQVEHHAAWVLGIQVLLPAPAPPPPPPEKPTLGDILGNALRDSSNG